MGGMVGSYIAATTAFLVNVAAPFAIRDLGLPESWYWLFWVGPPVAATVGLTLWQGAYRRKFRRGARPADVATVRIRTAGTEEPAPAAGAGTALAG
jgi:hypothetical protein